MRTYENNYRVVGVQGCVSDPGGMVITLEPICKNTERKKHAKDWELITRVLIVFFAIIFLGALTLLPCEKNGEKTAQSVPQPENMTSSPAEVVNAADNVVATPVISEKDFYIETVPMSYALQEKLYNASQEFGIPYELAVAVVWRETNFTNSYGDGGKAYGYFQIWPRWHKERANSLGVYDLMDAEGNFRVGCSLLADYIKGCDGDIHKALMTFNMGAGGASKLWRQGITSSEYSRSIVDYMEGLI